MSEFPFEMLRDLKSNWDSYGAPPIEERCIRKAHELWLALHALHGSWGSWQVVPCSDGSVQLEQHSHGFDIEILVRSASTVGDEHAR